MKINPIKGRLGNHRFHSILVHFPSALYPFSFTMDFLSWLMGTPAYADSGRYALIGALGTGALAMIYGVSDFLQLDSQEKPWRIAAIHGLLNISWFIIYAALLFYRIKHNVVVCDWPYLVIMGVTTIGLIFSNYLGADLIVRYRVGIDADREVGSKQ